MGSFAASACLNGNQAAEWPSRVAAGAAEAFAAVGIAAAVDSLEGVAVGIAAADAVWVFVDLEKA